MVDIVAGLRPGWPRVLTPVVESDFYVFLKMTRPAMGPTQPPVQRVLGFFLGGSAAGTC